MLLETRIATIEYISTDKPFLNQEYSNTLSCDDEIYITYQLIYLSSKLAI